MRENRLKTLLRAKKAAMNAWLMIPSSFSAEVISNCGFDAVTIDMQHGMIDFSQTVSMLQAISTTNATPLVRPTGTNPVEIMHLLDAGAYGVICPQVDDVGIAKSVVAACRYPPLGTRSFGPARGVLYGGSDYYKHANEEILIFVMIESKKAVDNLEDILDVDGIDGIFIGPNDLSLSFGHGPGSAPDGMVAEVIEKIRLQAAKRGLHTAIFCTDGAMCHQRIEQGFQMVNPGSDAGLLKAIHLAELARAKA